MTRVLCYATAAALLTGSAVWYGLLTDRWGPSPDRQAAAAKLAGLPAVVGGWEGRPVELNARMLAAADVTGHVARRYVHRGTGQEIMLLILCGRPGPVAVHTPDVCYQGAGYSPGPPEKRAAAGGTFWTAQFARTTAPPDALRIYWAWSDGGAWTAADNPRVAFARSPALYKLYAVR